VQNTTRSPKSEEQRRREVLSRLFATYPDARCELEYETPFQLLVATILSAQSTDARVNRITRALFQEVRGPEDLVRLGPEALSERIRDVGLYRAKARHLVELGRLLLLRHGGHVPQEREHLLALPGVGPKTANVVLSNAFGQPALAVDTHVFRVSHRLGLSQAPTPEKTERDLMELVPEAQWTQTHHTLIFHGRRRCHARRPDCSRCPVADLCPALAEGRVEPLSEPAERRA
jgi:endonuclease-3